MKPNILIVDDEKEARALLVHFVKEMEEGCAITEAADGITALDLLKVQDFDIVFLDIKMPGLNGIDVLKRLPKENFPAVILTTAFDNYALAGYDHNAIDYLLKPFNQSRFKLAFDKARAYRNYMLQGKPKEYLSSICVKQGTKAIFVSVGEIESFRANDEYIAAVTASGSYLFSHTLGELEQMLDAASFMRVHKSTIINISFITALETLASGDFLLRMRSGQTIRASRNYKDRIRFKMRNAVSDGKVQSK